MLNPEFLLIHILKLVVIIARINFKQLEGDAEALQVIEDSIDDSEKFLNAYCENKARSNPPFGASSKYMN